MKNDWNQQYMASRQGNHQSWPSIPTNPTNPSKWLARNQQCMASRRGNHQSRPSILTNPTNPSNCLATNHHRPDLKYVFRDNDSVRVIDVARDAKLFLTSGSYYVAAVQLIIYWPATNGNTEPPTINGIWIKLKTTGCFSDVHNDKTRWAILNGWARCRKFKK